MGGLTLSLPQKINLFSFTFVALPFPDFFSSLRIQVDFFIPIYYEAKNGNWVRNMRIPNPFLNKKRVCAHFRRRCAPKCVPSIA